jgi:hypothetical protein
LSASDRERAEAVIAGIERRLKSLVENRAFRFVNTGRAEAEAYLNALSTFVGWLEEDVDELEAELGVKFPAVFRAYVEYAAGGRGPLFAGSDAEPYHMAEYRERAAELIDEAGASDFLDDRSAVFLFHQGYSFLYFKADGGYDAPVFQFVEGEAAPRQIAPSFAEFLDAQARELEELNRTERESGGYLLTVYPGGYTRRVYPALGEGVRPLDMEDELI